MGKRLALLLLGLVFASDTLPAGQGGVRPPFLIKPACERHTALLAQYAALCGGKARDDVDRQFANELLASVLKAHQEFAEVSLAIGVLAQRALRGVTEDGIVVEE